MRHWILRDGAPVQVDLLTWGRWFEDHQSERVVARTELSPQVFVSTVFLGLDHNFFGDGPPILWETMIFGGSLDQDQWRYSSRAAAEAGHLDAVELARAVLSDPCSSF
jgi:hypothetical protein